MPSCSRVVLQVATMRPDEVKLYCDAVRLELGATNLESLHYNRVADGLRRVSLCIMEQCDGQLPPAGYCDYMAVLLAGIAVHLCRDVPTPSLLEFIGYSLLCRNFVDGMQRPSVATMPWSHVCDAYRVVHVHCGIHSDLGDLLAMPTQQDMEHFVAEVAPPQMQEQQPITHYDPLPPPAGGVAGQSLQSSGSQPSAGKSASSQSTVGNLPAAEEARTAEAHVEEETRTAEAHVEEEARKLPEAHALEDAPSSGIVIDVIVFAANSGRPHRPRVGPPSSPVPPVNSESGTTAAQGVPCLAVGEKP